jgi:CubicO group peptidase (beta-lactamase class C family)
VNQKNFPRTWSVIKEGIAEGVAPGFVVGLWQKKLPNEFGLAAFGNRRIEPSPLPMLETTIFDLASLTKVFATAPLTALMVERGWLSWNTQVSSILADYPHPSIEIRHLLSHTAGLTAWQPFWERLWKQFAPTPIYRVPVAQRQKVMRELVLGVAPDFAPGEKCVYSDLSFLILGFVLEELTRLPLDQAVKKWLWEPMGLTGPKFYLTHFRHLNSKIWIEEVAATENCSNRGGILQGQVHDDNCWAMGGYAGHAGVFADAKDILRFVKSLFEGFFSSKTLNAMWSRVSEPQGCERTLGWDTPSGSASSTGSRFSSQSVGHLGFTGTSLWIDLREELAVTLLSARVHPSRENIKIKAFRPKFHDAIRLDLGY